MIWVEKRNIRSIVTETPNADGPKLAVFHSLQRCIPRMMGVLVRIVSSTVEATDHRPTRMFGAILVATVKEI